MPRMKMCEKLSMTLLLMLFSLSVAAEIKLKPHVLASVSTQDMKQVLAQTRQALQDEGFDIVGEYRPYATATILVVTNDELKKNAAGSEHGGFGAIQRVALTQVKNQVQVSFTNPVYMANVYRMKGDLRTVRVLLEKALGFKHEFGAVGLTASELREYHYKIFMPYFDEPYEIKTFGSHQAALDAVEKGLRAGLGGTAKVYRVDVPDKQESVFGVAMTRDCSGDEFIMSKIDFDDIRSTTHLPYEILVSGKQVIALHAKFRIAQSFPDLSMVGDNSFFSIMCAPTDIESALSALLGVKSGLEESE